MPELTREEWQERNARLRAAYAFHESARGGGDVGAPPSEIADLFVRNRYMDGENGEVFRWELKPEYQQEYVDADDERVRAWLGDRGEREFLDENGKPIEQDDGGGRYVISANYRYEDLAQDPDFIGILPDGRAIFDRNNTQSWEVDDRQRAEETANRRNRQAYRRLVISMAAGPLLQGAGMFTGPGTGAELAAAPGQGFGTAASTYGASAVAPGAAAAAAPGSGVPTQPPAPVTDLSLAPGSGVPVTDISTTAANSGILRPVIDAGNSVANWYGSLSPAARLAVSTAVSTGAQALSSGAAQRAAQEAATERENRQREDRERRGRVPAVVNPYTPRPAGIIGSAFTPRPGGG